MKETQVQDWYLVKFMCDKLWYREVRPNTVSPDLFIEADLLEFLKDTELNKDNFTKLLKHYGWDEDSLIQDFIKELKLRILDSTNMAIFINNNKTITFRWLKFYLFYVSWWELDWWNTFNQNIFSVVQEMPYKFVYQDEVFYKFRPDVTFFVNWIYLGYCELKSNYNNQTAAKDWRWKIARDYLEAGLWYLKIANWNDVSQSVRKDFLKIFEKAIHITTTDLWDTFVIRNISKYLDEIRALQDDGHLDFSSYTERLIEDIKLYPVTDKWLDKLQRFEEVFTALYSREMMEKEILYYNFIERDVEKKWLKKQLKNEKWRLISPRPKQKFGTDKILSKIDEFLSHEDEPDYFIKKLDKELTDLWISEEKKIELIQARQKYQNNKNVYSLLLQYAAWFGKSNIIWWTTLQLKDLKKNWEYVYDKVIIVVDRLQLRDQIWDKMFNMNIANSMYSEVTNKKEFEQALDIRPTSKNWTWKRIIIVNIQKFSTIKEILDKDILEKLCGLRVAFLIDEIHRSNSGEQHEDMINLFDVIESQFNKDVYANNKKKKNLIIWFTATPTDDTLARFWEYNKYAEAEKIWVPFDSYTMKQAIEDGYILNPLKWIIPVSAKMYFEKPDDITEWFEWDTWYDEYADTDDEVWEDWNGKKYTIRKEKIYSNEERIKAISKFIVDMLVTTVYPQIRWTGKAMLATSSIPCAIKYKEVLEKLYAEKVQEPKYSRFLGAPIYVVYSDNQKYRKSSTMNNWLKEKSVLNNFAEEKNWLIIVVDKLQTWFDEPKLHTLFLDKEINWINAIQTISRVDRTTKYKNDCKIVDFSYRNVNVDSIKKAFEHFSNVVVSDFNPLWEEKVMQELYKKFIEHHLYEKDFERFEEAYKKSNENIVSELQVEKDFDSWIRSNPEHANILKYDINHYFRILNNIEYVIEFDEDKYANPVFLAFWRKFNYEYNSINKKLWTYEDVDIYYDNKIWIVELEEDKDKDKEKPKWPKWHWPSQPRLFNILELIRKRNEKEEKIEKMIDDFENKIKSMFEYIKDSEDWKRLIAKMKSRWNAFSESDIHKDFEKLYKRYVHKNESILWTRFLKETKDLTNKLCDDFEEWLR